MNLAPDHRRRELAQIHLAKKQLGLDDETYRDMLFVVARVRSAADLDFAGRSRVLEHLKSRGFRVKSTAKHGKKPKVSEGHAAQLGKIEALLADAGLPWEYLTHGKDGAPSLLTRLCGVERLEWATAAHLQKLITALVIDQRRRQKRPAPPCP